MFNEMKQLQKIRMVFTDKNPRFRKPNLSPSMTFVDGYTKDMEMKIQASPYSKMKTKGVSRSRSQGM